MSKRATYKVSDPNGLKELRLNPEDKFENPNIFINGLLLQEGEKADYTCPGKGVIRFNRTVFPSAQVVETSGFKWFMGLFFRRYRYQVVYGTAWVTVNEVDAADIEKARKLVDARWPISMGCQVSSDVCTVCGHRPSSRKGQQDEMPKV